ncbi:MAG: hypothetical protein R8K20_09645 [Gallionellaceae bacterium]
MKSIWILHEGNAKKTHDNALISLVIKHLSQTIPSVGLDKVEFHGMGSKSNFFKTENYPKLLKEGVATDKISNVLFIVDSDCFENDEKYGGYDNTEKELNNLIAELGFQEVSSIHIVYDPTTTNKTGYLESFLLSTIPKDRMECINQFLKCSGFIDKDGDKSTYKRVYESVAYPFHPYRLEHSHFDELKAKLLALFAADIAPENN